MTTTPQPPSVACIRFVRRVWRAIRYNRFTLFIGIVWRPVTGDEGDTWWQARNKYPLHAADAWAIASNVYDRTERLARNTPDAHTNQKP